MKLAISNIAWHPSEEQHIAEELHQLGVKYVEIAPTKVWDDPLAVNEDQIKEYQDFWAKFGIEVVAFQSMLFPRPDLKLFGSEEVRAETLDYLKKFIGLAGKMNAGILVFGSPKNRQRGDMAMAEASEIAQKFFYQLGEEAVAHNTCFCIEPNAEAYACDFVTTAEEGMELVQKVNHPGFGLHLDIACMTLAHDDVAQSIKAAAPLLKHFHISSPMLESVEERLDVDHAAAGSTLRAIGYDRFVSIEMRPAEEGTNLERVRTAVKLAQKYY